MHSASAWPILRCRSWALRRHNCCCSCCSLADNNGGCCCSYCSIGTDVDAADTHAGTRRRSAATAAASSSDTAWAHNHKHSRTCSRDLATHPSPMPLSAAHRRPVCCRRRCTRSPTTKTTTTSTTRWWAPSTERGRRGAVSARASAGSSWDSCDRDARTGRLLAVSPWSLIASESSCQIGNDGMRSLVFGLERRAEVEANDERVPDDKVVEIKVNNKFEGH